MDLNRDIKQSPIIGVSGIGGGTASYINYGTKAPSGADVMYDYFFSSGASAINCSSSNTQTFNPGINAGQVGGTHNALDAFLDHSQQKIWGAYSTVSSYAWNNGGNTYGNSSFYAISGVQTNVAGHTTSGLGGAGRGITMAVLSDNTPVLVVSRSGLNQFHFFNYPSGTYIGYQITNIGTNQPNEGGDWAGLAWDGGDHLLVAARGDSQVYAYSLPSSTSAISSSTAISTVAKWTTSHAVQYGMVYGGGNRLYITENTNNGNVTQFLLSGTASQVGYSGSSSVVTTYQLGVQNYSLMMDYKNRKLILGGFNNNQYLIVGE